MRNFSKYTERRDSCEAIQYGDSSEAYWLATELFGSWKYSVSPEFLIITNVSHDLADGPRDSDDNLLISRGDYIVRDPFFMPRYKVIPRSEFRSKWESADAIG